MIKRVGERDHHRIGLHKLEQRTPLSGDKEKSKKVGIRAEFWVKYLKIED